MFAPLEPRPTAVDRCEAALRRSILEGLFAPGERLPPERRLAESFAVNRVTVRSALSRLSAAGLVQARQGSGYTVRSFHDHGGPDLLPGIVDLAREDGTFAAVVRDLLRVRRHLARAVVEQLSDHPPSIGALDAFDESVVAFAEVIADAPEDDAAVGDADLAVLGALLRATGSTVLTLCLNPVCAVVRDLPALRRALYCDPVANLKGWRALGLLLRSSDLAEEPKVALDALSALLDARDRATLDRLGASP